MNPREQHQIRERIIELQARGDLFARKLVGEKQRAADIEAELVKVTQEIETFRETRAESSQHRQQQHAGGGENNPARYMAEASQNKLVHKLESRLDNALVRQNEILNENNDIKNKIERIRRKIQNAADNQTEKTRRLQEIQHSLEEVSKKTLSLKDQKDKVDAKRTRLLNQNMQEKEQFSVACRELGEFISSQAELLGKSIASAANDVLLEQDDSSRIGTPANDIKLLDVKLQELDHQFSNDKLLLKQTEKKIQNYEENIEQLKAASGLTNLEEILKECVKNEEELFSYFNYIQIINQETDITLGQLAHLELEISNFTKDQVDKESARLAVVNTYKVHLTDAQEDRKKISSMAREAKDTAECIAKKVRKLFDDLKCKDTATTTKSNREGDTYQNIMHYMKVIERKCTDIIAEYAKALANGRRGRRPSVLMSPKLFDKVISTAGTRPSSADDNNLGTMEFSEDDEDSDEEGDGNGVPVSLDEMRRIAAQRLNNPRESIMMSNVTTEQRLRMKRMTII